MFLFAGHGNPLSKDDGGCTPLHYAARKGHFEHFQLVFERAKCKNPKTQHGTTVLHAAARNGNYLVCSLIFDYLKNNHEGNLDQFQTSSESFDFIGRTPFYLAASCGNLEVCQLFLKNYPDKNPKTQSGNTPLHAAASNGHYEVCKLIIDNIVDKNPANSQGWTPQHFACDTYHRSKDINEKSKLMAVNQLFVESSNGKNPKTNPFYLFGDFGYTPTDIAKGYHRMTYLQRYFSFKFWIGLFFCLMLRAYMSELDSECNKAYISMLEYYINNFGTVSTEDYYGMTGHLVKFTFG